MGVYQMRTVRMSKLLTDMGDYEKYTGYTADSFYDKYIKPVITSQKKTLAKKEIISYDFKWAVWERDNFTCQHCGSRKNLSVDHIIPESKGGQLTMENVQTLCCKCNSKKGAR